MGRFQPCGRPAYPSLGRNITGFGGDLPLMDLQNARRVRIAPQSFDAAPAAPAAQPLGVPKIRATLRLASSTMGQ